MRVNWGKFSQTWSMLKVISNTWNLSSKLFFRKFQVRASCQICFKCNELLLCQYLMAKTIVWYFLPVFTFLLIVLFSLFIFVYSAVIMKEFEQFHDISNIYLAVNTVNCLGKHACFLYFSCSFFRILKLSIASLLTRFSKRHEEKSKCALVKFYKVMGCLHCSSKFDVCVCLFFEKHLS